MNIWIVRAADVQVDRTFEQAEIIKLNACLSEPWKDGEAERRFRLADDVGFDQYGKSALGDYLLGLLADAGWKATFHYSTYNKQRELTIFRPKPTP